MPDGVIGNPLKTTASLRHPTPEQGLALIVLKIRETEWMESLHQRNTTSRGESGMGSVIVNHNLPINFKQASVIAPHGEIPYTVRRYVKIACENISEMILIRSILDRRSLHDP